MDTSNTKPYHIPSDAVWFITGCSSGIGLALAQLIAAQPTYRLVATARNPSSLAAPAIPDSPRVLKLALDVTSQASVDAAVSAALARFGRLDVAVNNAGYALSGDTENASDEEARREVETIFWGTVRVALKAVRAMREDNARDGGQQGGLIMNVTSMGGFIGFPGTAFYHASKFAVEGFTESVAKEMRPEWNIHFCLIEPGGTQTNYATTSTVRIHPPHPAYDLPDSPSRVLDAYVSDPKMRESWSTPEDVAAAMLAVAAGGRRIPIRIPLGPDAWTMLKAELRAVERDLDEFKDISEKVGVARQAGAIDFLRKQG